MATQAQLTARRAKAVRAALDRLDQAYRYTVAALELDEQVDLTDRYGDLARAADDIGAASRTIRNQADTARLRRRNFDQQVAAEAAAGGPEAYARERGLL